MINTFLLVNNRNDYQLWKFLTESHEKISNYLTIVQYNDNYFRNQKLLDKDFSEICLSQIAAYLTI